MSWAVHEVEDEVHVAPILDLRPHALSAGCSCQPVRKLDLPITARPLWVHNAFDGREFTERAIAAWSLKGAMN